MQELPSSRVATFVLALLALSACRRGEGIGVSIPVPMSVVAESRTIDHAMPARAGQLSAAEVEAVAPAIRTLRADPEQMHVSLGDTVRVADHVRILALDSLGIVLGELPFYDFGYAGRGFRLLADGRVHLRRRGTVVFTARLPARLWHRDASSRPSARVPLVVERVSR